MMELTVLGSGTAVPDPERFPAGYLIANGSGRLLIDCGPGVIRRLAQAGTDPTQLDAVLLTHYHTDHCADLAALLFALRSEFVHRTTPIRIYGAPGLRRLVAKLREAWPWLEPHGYELELHELVPGTTTIDDFTVESVAIRHTAQSLGYRVHCGQTVVALSGDADTCEALVDLSRDADVFVCDAATPDGQKLDGHLTPRLAAAYAQRGGARHLVLTHFYPPCQDQLPAMKAAAAALFDGEISMATDLLRIAVAPS
ncbi:MAG: MBL fold metallo-hydrolase [Planctomycetota bacterium]